jgi:glycosyltransferase involved in cell wall biosynthesis
VVVVGPTYPYRGGISHYTTMLAQALADTHQVRVVSFRRQYPRLLYPGRSDKDPSQQPLCVPADYVLDPVYPWTWWQAASSIARFKPDVVVAQWWTTFWAPALSGLAFLLHRSRIPLVFVVHNVLPHEARAGDVWLARRALRAGDSFVVHSQDERARLLTLLPRRRVELVSMPLFTGLAGQTLSRNAARVQLGLPHDAPTLLFFGLVREYKGVHYLLDAMPKIRAELADVRLLIVGEFWQDKQAYLDQIEQLGLGPNVVIVDRYISNEEVPAYFSAANVVVLPYTDVTQSAVVPLAFAFGVPVITTRVGGLADVVRDGETGFLVEPGDVDGLSRAIVRFFREDLAASVRANIEHSRAQFGWERLIHAVLKPIEMEQQPR